MLVQFQLLDIEKELWVVRLYGNWLLVYTAKRKLSVTLDDIRIKKVGVLIDGT